MIGWHDVYKILVAVVPLYVALALGYGSVKWWHIFKQDQCAAINRFSYYFIIPFFCFEFLAHIDPYQMNFRFIMADIVAKTIIGVGLIIWANFWKKGNYSWAITGFSLCSLNNTLVVGVPVLKAMYGSLGADLAVQSYVVQSLLWFPILLLMLEFRQAQLKESSYLDDIVTSDQQLPPMQTERTDVEERMVTSDQQLPSTQTGRNDVEERHTGEADLNDQAIEVSTRIRAPLWSVFYKVWTKLVKNPNYYSCVTGVIWSLLANRWHFEMPSILEGSITIMSKGGSGVIMFILGMFMALQPKMIACGLSLTTLGMVLRFVAGPLTMAVASLALGLRGDVFCVTLVQAALPQAIASFVFAQEYGLHATVLSTGVIFGTIVSLPILIAYYVILDVVDY